MGFKEVRGVMEQTGYSWLLVDALPPSFPFGGSPHLTVSTWEQNLTSNKSIYLGVSQIFLTEFSSFPFSHLAYAMSSFCRDLLESLFIYMEKKKKDCSSNWTGLENSLILWK